MPLRSSALSAARRSSHAERPRRRSLCFRLISANYSKINFRLWGRDRAGVVRRRNGPTRTPSRRRPRAPFRLAHSRAGRTNGTAKPAEMARPVRRNKKAVDYSQFGDTDDDDEDFASISAPSNKKSKRIRSEPAKEKTVQRKQTYKEENRLQKRSPIKRMALDDKLYHRDLEVALALSVDESSSVSSPKIQDLEEQVLDDSAKDCNATEDTFGHPGEIPKQKLQSKVNGTNNYDLEPDFEAESNSSSSEEEDEFVMKKKTKVNKKGGKNLNVRNVKKIEKPSKSTRNVMESQPVSQNAFSSPELIGKPLKTSSPSTTKMPNWTPPGASGSNSSQLRKAPMKSPTQGLRLGLSRLAKVKPLHQSLVSR